MVMVLIVPRTIPAHDGSSLLSCQQNKFLLRYDPKCGRPGRLEWVERLVLFLHSARAPARSNSKAGEQMNHPRPKAVRTALARRVSGEYAVALSNVLPERESPDERERASADERRREQAVQFGHHRNSSYILLCHTDALNHVGDDEELYARSRDGREEAEDADEVRNQDQHPQKDHAAQMEEDEDVIAQEGLGRGPRPADGVRQEEQAETTTGVEKNQSYAVQQHRSQ